MNPNLPALSGPTTSLQQKRALSAPVQTGEAEPASKRLAQSGSVDSPTPHSLTDFTITRAEQSTTMRVQDELATRFKTLCTDDDGDTLAKILSGMSEEEVLNWLNTPLDFSERKDIPMMYAARHDCVSIASVLLSHKSNPVAINPHSETQSHPLFIAAQENNVNIIRVMSTADTFDPLMPRGDGFNAMHVAIQANHQEITKVLLEECKADPNHKCQAIVLEGTIAPVQSFTEDQVTRGSKCWLTLMNFAASKARTEILEQLILKGGKVENVDPDNPKQQSPLAAALLGASIQMHDCTSTIDLLLSKGADMHEFLPLSPEEPLSYPRPILREAKLAARPTLCQFACFLIMLPATASCARIFHKHYQKLESANVSLNDFVLQHASGASGGTNRFIATSSTMLNHIKPFIPLASRLTNDQFQQLLIAYIHQPNFRF